MADQPRGGGHDLGGGPVVPADGEHGAARVGALERVEARHVAAPPPVDRLVVVAREGDGAVRRREGLDERMLERAEILRLVDQEGAEARA